MNRLIRFLSISMLAVMLLSSCNSGSGNADGTTTTTTTTTTEQKITAVSPLENYNEAAEITVEYEGESATGNGSAELALTKTYATGKKITVTIPETQNFIAITIAKNVLDESYVYVTGGKFEYRVPSFDRSYPADLKNKNSTISVRIPTVEELTTKHNLALNTCDLLNAKNAFPHATTTNVHNNDAEWMARNAIDGFTQNNGHGTFPYQSWGPGSTMSPNDEFKIDFGHDVVVSELSITIRADFAQDHDGYWNKCRVYFSDGTYQEINLTDSAKPQKIAIEGGEKITSYVSFKRFTKADKTKEWCAWMEVKVNGTEISPNK